MLLYIYVDDADDTYQRVVAVRAETVEAPTDQFYGERRATVKDSYGNMYQMASPIESCDAARTTSTAAMHFPGASSFVCGRL